MINLFKRALSICVLVCFIGTASVCAQNSARKDLCLWQVSGNGLQQPSYLLGVYYSLDDRAFAFNDSTYNKLVESNQVALFLQPDSMLKYMMSNDYGSHNISCKDLLSAKEFRQLEDKYRQEGSKLSHYSAFEVFNELLVMAYKTKTHREMDIDSYLYNIAKSENKKVVGIFTLKNVMTQFYAAGPDHVKQMILEMMQANGGFKECQEKMLDAFANGDLEKMGAIYKSCNLPDYKYFKDQLAFLPDMVFNLQQLMGKEGTFAEVPAGFLLCENGLVERLKDLGYTVNPVHAPYTGLIDTLSQKPHLGKWITFGGAEYGYTVQMPNTPKLIQGQSLYSFYDPIKNTVYLTLAKHLGGDAMKKGVDKLFDSIQTTMDLNKGWTLRQMGVLDKGGIPGRQFEVTTKDKSNTKMLAQVFLQDSTFYMFMVGGDKEANTSLPELSDYFFNSIKLVDPHVVQLETIASPKAGISFSMPQGWKFVDSEVLPPAGEEDRMPVGYHYWSYDNRVRDMAVVVRYNDLKRGYVIRNYKDHFKSLIDDLKDQFGKQPFYHFMEYKGLPGVSFEAETKTSRIKGMFLLRNNRTYLMMYAENSKSFDQAFADSILNSVSILPLVGEPLKDNALYSIDLKAKLPEPPFIRFDSTYYIVFDLPSDSNFVVYSKDTSNGLSYTLQVYHLSAYASIENYDTLVANFNRDWVLTENNDSLLSTKEVVSNGIKWHEIVVGRFVPFNCERVRLAVAGRYLLKVLMVNDLDSLYTARADSFFNSVDFISKPTDFDLYKDRAGEVLADIGSSNDTVRQNAYSALKAFHFRKQHQQLVHKALLAPSYPDDSLGFNSSRAELITRLYDTDEDKGLTFIEENYSHIALNTEQRLQVMSYLSRLSNSTAYNMLFDMFEDSMPGARDDAYVYSGIFSNLMDSMSLGLPYLQQLPALTQKHPDITYAVYHAFAKAIEDSVLDYYDVVKSQDVYLKTLGKMVELRKQQIKQGVDTISNEEFYIIKDLVTMFKYGRPNKQIKQLLDDMDKVETNTFLNYYVLRTRLKLHYEPNKKHVKTLVGNRLFRVAVYNLMANADMLKQYPKKYTEPRYWGESDLYNTITDDPEYSNAEPEIAFVESRNIRYNGYSGLVCIYKFRIDKDSPWLFGASGLYQKGHLDPISQARISGSNYRAFDKIRITQYLNELVQGTGNE